MNERQIGQRSGGRPRDAAIDEGIIEAATILLQQVGYAGLSLEAVAARAGVSRPAIYRRYANKTALVIDVVMRIASVEATHEGMAPRFPDQGSLRADLEALLVALESSFDALAGRGIVPGFLADLIAHPELAADFFRLYLEPAQSSVRQVFAAAAERGEIPSVPIPEIVISQFVGAYIYHRFVVVQDFTDDDRRLVASVLSAGLAQALGALPGA